ncbi:MAG TPA: hypothetical protein VI248_25595 [Kineosporiaceae bacterium]
MSYAEELLQMTRALTDVARLGQQQLTGHEIHVALVARRGVLELLTTVHHDLTDLRPRRTVTEIGDLEAHPVAALGQALTRHPRPPLDLAPSEAFTRPAGTPSGQAWQRAGRHALLAHDHWTRGDGPAPDHATRWAGLADIAAIGRQLAVLDVELADTLRTRAPAWRDQARILVGAATSGLGTAARETARLAAGGPLAASGPDRIVSQRRIVLARTAADLPATQRRLAEFLDGASNLLPQRLPHLATAIARCALLVRDQLPVADPTTTALRGELREHARLLQQATVCPGFAVCLDTGDARPLRQAAEAWQGLSRHAAALRADRQLLIGYVDALAASAQALAGAVDRSVRRGRWLVPDRETSLLQPSWKRLRPSAPPPRPVLAVRAVAAHAVTLRQVTAEAHRPSAPVQVAQVLAHASGRPAALPPRDVVPDPAPRRPRMPSEPVASRPRPRR